MSAGRRREEAQTGVAVGGCVQRQEEYLLRDAPPFLMRGAAWKHHRPANHGAAEAGNWGRRGLTKTGVGVAGRCPGPEGSQPHASLTLGTHHVTSCLRAAHLEGGSGEEGGKARRGGASFAGASIPRKLSPQASKSPPSRPPTHTHHIYHHPTDLFPTNPLHCPKNPQFLKILPDAQIHSEEERGREMPNQQPAFGTLV